MKNKKNIFGEARFVFMSPGAEKPSGISSGPEGTRIDVRERLVSLLTKGRLNILKKSLETSGIEFKNETFKVVFPLENEKSVVAELSGKIEKLLDKESNNGKFEKLKKMGEIGSFFPDKDIKSVVAIVYAKDFVDKAKVEFRKEFSHFEKFVAEKKIKDLNVECNIVHDATGKYKFKFSTENSRVIKDYKEWAKKNVKTTKKSAETVAKNPDIEEFAKSPLGKIFKFLKGEGGKNWLQLMAEGKAPIAVFIAGLFGYKIGADAYGGVVDMLPAKYKNKIDDLQKMAGGSRWSAKAYAKKRPKGKEVAGKVQGVNKKFFEYAVKDNDVPKGGMRLDVDYKLLAGEKLEMDLSGGGKVVLPKGIKANVNGALSNAGETYTSGKVVFKNLIPKGTVFTGKIAFTKVALKKKA